MPTQNLLNQGNDTLYIEGSYLRPVEIKDLLINETGGMSAPITALLLELVARSSKPSRAARWLRTASLVVGLGKFLGWMFV